MADFDIEQLRSFVVAIETGSLTAAAPLRCLSQSAISEQIRKLEQRANQTLLIRSKSGVLPTLAGEKLLAHARRILTLSEAAWQDLQGITVQGEMHLGITDYCKPDGLANILVHLSLKYPQLRLRTTVGRSADIENSWKNQDIDLAIVMRLCSEQSSSLSPHETLLGREAMLWAGNRISVEKPLPLVLLPEECSIHQLTIKTLKKARIPYFIQHIASSVKGIQSALEAGLGVSCLNYSSLPYSWRNTEHFPTLPQLPKAEFVLLNGKNRYNQFTESKLDLSDSIINNFSRF